MLFILVQFFIVEGVQKRMPELLAGTMFFKLYDHLYYLFGARMLCYVGGMLIAKYNVLSSLKTYFSRYSVVSINFALTILLVISSLVLCLLSKGILLIFFALVVFCLFNLYHKSLAVSTIFSWLGKQSLYIWLLHPFICYSTFPMLRDWLLSFKYSILIFVVLLLVCSILGILLNKISDRLIKQVVNPL